METKNMNTKKTINFLVAALDETERLVFGGRGTGPPIFESIDIRDIEALDLMGAEKGL